MVMEHTAQYWDQRYEGEAYRFGEAPSGFLVEEAHRLEPGMRVLVVADGEGRNGVWLAEQGMEVVSTDVSPLAVAKAQDLALRRQVKIDARVADLSDWEWPLKRFDAVVGVFIQFAGPELRDETFAGMKAAVKPGGLILLQGYRPEQLAYGTGGPRQEDRTYTERLLYDAFGDFGILSLQSYDAELSEGVGHAGMSALIDMVARRPRGPG